jgi:hypothetical protein
MITYLPMRLSLRMSRRDTATNPSAKTWMSLAVNYRPPAPERWGGGFLFESGAGRFLAGVLRPLVPMGRCD